MSNGIGSLWSLIPNDLRFDSSAFFCFCYLCFYFFFVVGLFSFYFLLSLSLFSSRSLLHPAVNINIDQLATTLIKNEYERTIRISKINTYIRASDDNDIQRTQQSVFLFSFFLFFLASSSSFYISFHLFILGGWVFFFFFFSAFV
jgi:hypothetical protein